MAWHWWPGAIGGSLGLGLAGLAAAAPPPLGTAAPFTPADVYQLREVEDPDLAPDGAWVAYTVRTSDLARDRPIATVAMSPFAGGPAVRLAGGQDSAWHARFSPDGRRIAFLSDRGASGQAQLWLLDRAGGEANPTHTWPGGVGDFAWSPDGKQLAVIARDADPALLPNARADAPIVIDRYYFKEDETGYLTHRRQHLYVLDLASGESVLLAPGDFDELRPAWSPDGTRIAFFSKRSGDPDRHERFGLYLIEPRAGAALRLLTEFQGESGDSQWMAAPVFSPDGRTLAFVAGGEPRLIWYAVHHLATVPVAGGATLNLTPALDRNVLAPAWSADGRSLYFLVEDDRNQPLARVAAGGGAVARLTGGRRVLASLAGGAKDRLVAIESTPTRPFEVVAIERGDTRPLSHENDDWLAGRRLARTEELTATSVDGTTVSGFLVKPADFEAGRRYPAILRIHGGPTAQFANEFHLDWQVFASAGYVVVAGNPRGSSGRGEAYAAAIYADWGTKDGEDVLALVDRAVALGSADPALLGIGGWSYGGILTEQVIARDRRFKAAIAGAGSANALAGYGTDMYVRGYETELGLPWRTPEAYLHNSQPFLNADRIATPTLLLCGERDFNVPLLNSEQLYQALRSLGRETGLVIYPGEFHSFKRPSHLEDRLGRYLAWYGRFLGSAGAAH